MNIILISLFSSLILHGHVNIGFRWRLLVAKVTKKPMEELLLKPIKVLDCFPCMSFWISVFTALGIVGYNSPLEALAQYDWQQVAATFIIASFYDKLKA